MAKKYFGTDGVRGEVGQFPINPDFVLKLGYAAGQVLVQHEGEIKPTVLIGKDTRISGYMLERCADCRLYCCRCQRYSNRPSANPGRSVSDPCFAFVCRCDDFCFP